MRGELHWILAADLGERACGVREAVRLVGCAPKRLRGQKWRIGLDQQLAGGILWGSGDLIALTFFAVLFTQWVRSSMAEAKREDRRLDRLEAREQAAASARTGDG